MLIRLSNPTVDTITVYCMAQNTTLFIHSVFIKKQKLYVMEERYFLKYFHKGFFRNNDHATTFVVVVVVIAVCQE